MIRLCSHQLYKSSSIVRIKRSAYFACEACLICFTIEPCLPIIAPTASLGTRILSRREKQKTFSSNPKNESLPKGIIIWLSVGIIHLNSGGKISITVRSLFYSAKNNPIGYLINTKQIEKGDYESIRRKKNPDKYFFTCAEDRQGRKKRCRISQRCM